MLISVKLVDGLTQEYEFDESKTVFQFKEFLSEQTGLQPEQIGLIYKGAGLRDPDVIGNKIQQQGPPVTMIAQLRGGQY
eukprot:UN02888